MMQHKKRFLDRPKGPAVTAPKGDDGITHISASFAEVIRGLAERHNMTEDQVIAKLRGKVKTADEL